MSHRQDIELFIEGTEIDTSAARDRQVLSEVLDAHRDFRRKQPQEQQPRRWKVIAETGRGKWVMAAAIPLAVILSIVVSEMLREPAWAIEQTIAAIEGFQAVYGSGILSLDGKTEVRAECWARPNRDGTRSGDMRMQTASGRLIVVNEARDTTHTYDPPRNTVAIQGGDGLYCRPWVSGDYFRHMKGACEQWSEKYVRDAATGRNTVVDLETKLPIRGKVWHNPDFGGSPYFDVEKLVYNPVLPEGIFDFEIPSGATIVDRRSG
jgi:hypothetical protein